MDLGWAQRSIEYLAAGQARAGSGAVPVVFAAAVGPVVELAVAAVVAAAAVGFEPAVVD